MPATALWTAHQREEGVRIIVEQATTRGCAADGTYRTSVRQVAVANTSGLEGCYATSLASLRTVVRGRHATGYRDAYARDASRLNPFEVAESAISKGAMLPRRGEIEPGVYPVVLEPNAVADLLVHLAPMFGARGTLATRVGDTPSRNIPNTFRS